MNVVGFRSRSVFDFALRSLLGRPDYPDGAYNCAHLHKVPWEYLSALSTNLSPMVVMS